MIEARRGEEEAVLMRSGDQLNEDLWVKIRVNQERPDWIFLYFLF